MVDPVGEGGGGGAAQGEVPFVDVGVEGGGVVVWGGGGGEFGGFFHWGRLLVWHGCV